MPWPAIVTVHPHTRGEQRCQNCRINTISGSSPHTWGTGRLCKRDLRQLRFIPTHVGNSFEFAPLFLQYPVHPHTRGEQSPGRRQNWRGDGSSPHTWGTVTQKLAARGLFRFIPTHVGNSQGRYSINKVLAVHPHTRGEQCRVRILILTDLGSSPHTWGTGIGRKSNSNNSRFIPPHVGNRTVVGFSARLTSVHPHTRGEQVRLIRAIPDNSGSSPHTWGTGQTAACVCLSNRFIPTHVGNSHVNATFFETTAVHPHTRGEQICQTTECMPEPGSSPHTWGTGQSNASTRLNNRFIPTHVGNRTNCSLCLSLESVHPHTRGEQLPWQSFCGRYAGSSPHTWGTGNACVTRV